MANTTDIRSDRSAIMKLAEGFIASVNRADTNAFVAFFAEDATAFFPNHATEKQGIAQIREVIASAFAQGPRTVPAKLSGLKIVERGPVALVTFDGGTGSQHARRTLYLEKRHGEWLVVHLHASNANE